MPITNDPQAGRYILITDDGVEAVFATMRDLGTKSEVIEHRVVTADGKEIIRKVPGQTSVHNVVLTRPVSAAFDLTTWRREIEDMGAKARRKSGRIVAYNEQGQPMAEWTFTNGWLSKLVTNVATGLEEATLTIDTLIRVWM